jgi:hypothetical protein
MENLNKKANLNIINCIEEPVERLAVILKLNTVVAGSNVDLTRLLLLHVCV